MREIRTFGSMSGEGKRSDADWPKLPRPSSTLLPRDFECGGGLSAFFSPRRPGILQVSVREGSQDDRLADRLQAPTATVSFIGLFDGHSVWIGRK